MAFLLALLLTSFIAEGMAMRSKLEGMVDQTIETDEQDHVFDLGAHLEDFAHLAKKTRPQNCDTAEIHAAAGEYENKLIGSKHPTLVPSAVLMVGGPGSGKSTARRLLASDEEYAIMDVDDILKHVYKPKADSYYDCYEPAMVRYKTWLATLIMHKINLVIDGTGRKFDEYVELGTQLQNASYTTALISVVLPFEVAKERMETRAKLENRVVDTKYAEGVYKTIEEILPRYLRQAAFDSVFVFSNDVPQGNPPQRLLVKKGEDEVECSFDGREDENEFLSALAQFCA